MESFFVLLRSCGHFHWRRSSTNYASSVRCPVRTWPTLFVRRTHFAFDCASCRLHSCTIHIPLAQALDPIFRLTGAHRNFAITVTRHPKMATRNLAFNRDRLKLFVRIQSPPNVGGSVEHSMGCQLGMRTDAVCFTHVEIWRKFKRDWNNLRSFVWTTLS